MTEPEHSPAPAIESSGVYLFVSPDSLTAEVEARGSADPTLNYNRIINLLNERGIVYGVDASAIHKLVDAFRARPGTEPVRALVAKGVAPQPSRDGKVQILIAPPPPVVIDDEGKADFRNVQRYQSVDAGTVLATREPPVLGKAGINIFGEAAEPGVPADADLKAGPNVIFNSSSNEYKAKVHGIFVHSGDVIDVNPVLRIKGNVGLETGNINYDGNVEISGNIERGSAVSALGDVVVGGQIESGQLRVSGSLTCKTGINTRREDTIRVSSNLLAVYIDHSDLEVDGTVLVERSITSSRLIVYGELIVRGQNSAISGCDVTCFGSVAADYIGTKAGTPTHLWLGMHHKNVQYYELTSKELEKAEKEYAKLSEDIARIKQYVVQHRGQLPVDKQAAFRIKLNEYKQSSELVTRLRAQVQSLRVSRFNNEEVRVIARNTIYPGVEIHYQGRTEKIVQPIQFSTIRFRPDLPDPVYGSFDGKRKK